MKQMETQEIAVQVSNVKKKYKLGQIGGGTLQGDLQSWWARIRGKEDPNIRVDVDQRLIGQTFMALNGIDLTIYKGEALGIIGRNGAGKSTLLKLLSQVTAPTSGEIDIYGRIASMLEVGTGFNGEMTGRENVYLNGAILGMSKEEIDSKMEDIIEFSEVREFIDTPVKRYSSGMYVKLAFSVAAHLDSEIMIMDEVLAVGDMAFQKKCLTKMREAANKEGRTILYVSHNMNTIRQLCDRCIVLDKGKIIYDGDVNEAISLYLNIDNKIETLCNFTNYERPDWLGVPSIKLLTAEYIDKKDCLFQAGEPLRLHLRWQNLKNVNHVGLRIEIASIDGDPHATYVLYDFYSGKANELSEVSLELNADCFMDAKYRMTYTFFQKDAYGNNQDLDCVPGLFFEKTMVNAEQKMDWHAKNWGYIQLPTPKIL